MGIETKTEDRRWRVLYGGVMKQLGAGMRAEGLELVRSGTTEQQALVLLGERTAHWLTLARQLLGSAVTTSQS